MYPCRDPVCVLNGSFAWTRRHRCCCCRERGGHLGQHGPPNLVACYTFELVPLRVQPQEGGAEGIMRAGSSVGVAVGDDGSTPDAWRLILVLERCNSGSLRSFLAAGWDTALAAVASSQAAGGAPSTASAAAAPQAVEVLAVARKEVAPRRPALPQLPPATIARLALDVARGMAYLHGRGVAHGDLSSANVLLHLLPTPPHRNDTAENAGSPLQAGPNTQSPSPAQLLMRLTAKVCDFGLSQQLGRRGPGTAGVLDADRTHVTGPCRRSSAYSAPELVRHGHTGYKQVRPRDKDQDISTQI
ncbi:hypothetical protein TSOC_013946 [Tetrabaena socialis]|uniref:Protein kinase domain-containing protein n=1 Tax=Tetrabaena socialis TaxID=47790 RepID=A0A2J7ZIZ6_9CHLO|nr:hypothetical protein TSOC_013946 [Tetrabaena socialis]|eukprot:PNH00242.1 hypothetical protein TSOC_013946 [Tetrabaena socialis]